MLSYLDKPPEPPADPLFPTESSLDLFSMINGTAGACVGQTIHQVLRDPSVFRKQIFYTMFRFILNGVNIADLSSAWTTHRQRFVHTDDERVLVEQFEIWSNALKHTLIETTSAALQKLIYAYGGDDRYCRYVDWIASVGVVPIVEVQTLERMRAVEAAQRSFTTELVACQILDRLDDARLKTLRACVRSLMTREIPNVPDVRIHRLKSNGRIECFSGKKRLRRYIYAEPLMLEEDCPVLTTPLARIRYERKRHHELRTHRKVCQLLNTNPVKVVTSSRHELNTRRIVELMEKRDRNVDAKTSIVKFLLNVSDSKSKIGLEDSIESFLQDLTPSVDQSRLMPSRAPIPSSAATSGSSGTHDIRELFRRQVIRCLEDQIQDHVEEIESLKLLNKTWESKTRELRDALERYETEGRRASRWPPSSDLQTLDTLNALRRVQTVPTNPVSVDDNRVVANSFFSQFVPDDRDSDDRLSRLWENEYFRCFRLRKNITNQGTEESTSYSNYTVERVLLPFLTSVLEFPLLDPIPEEYLFLSLSELATVVYETGKLQKYTDFIRYREIIRLQILQEERARRIATTATIASTTAAPVTSWPLRSGNSIPLQIPPPGTLPQRQVRVPTFPPAQVLTPYTSRSGEPPTKVRVTEAQHTYLPPYMHPGTTSPTPNVYLRFRSPHEKLDVLRKRRNVQQFNG